MDLIITNSNNVQKRLYNYVGLTSEVIYPGVNTHDFKWIADDGYFISLARLEKQKRVDLIIKAFIEMPDQRLIVLSGGSEEDHLKQIANGAHNIQFFGWVSEQKLRELIGRARAAIYLPTDEDFGMSPVEAMAAGKPVIGVAEGGLLETIVDSKSGYLLPIPLNVENIKAAVMQLSPEAASTMRQVCEERASLFSESVFHLKMKRALELTNGH